jgi:ribose/xylose/arabinose/galactoside ABC-type transport system permease subunit
MNENAAVGEIPAAVRKPRRFQLAMEPIFPLGILLALCVVLSFVSEFFLTSENLSNLLGNAAVLAIVSFGVTIVIISGNFDLSVGSGVGLVGMTSAWTMVNTGSLLLGILVGFGTGIAIGLANGVLSSYLTVLPSSPPWRCW